MITLTFPDGAQRQYEPGITGWAVAEGIAKSLAKRTVAMALDGRVADLSDPILRDARIEFLTREDPRALELIRHDAAHVLAEAVQSLFPGTQVTIGPAIGPHIKATSISPASRSAIIWSGGESCRRSAKSS